MALALFLGGLGVLAAGAELLVRGASRLAAAIGISPLVVGLTVVAFGTSSPEAAVSVEAAMEGRAEIALGNIVGSNVFNILIVLGLSALVTPLVVSRRLVWLDVPIMIGANLVFLGMCLDGMLDRWDGLALLAGLLWYIWFTVRQSRREPEDLLDASRIPVPSTISGRLASLAIAVVGLLLLVAGSRWMVSGAVMIARGLGAPELVIGLTIVAVGTSLPEVATSLMASFRGERDIAVGNAVGSCIFNILGIGGLAALVASTPVHAPAAALGFDMPVMIAVSIACLPIFFTAHRIDRWEGFLFCAYYCAYVAYLVLEATGSVVVDLYGATMLLFVVPLTVVTLVVLMVRAPRKEGSPWHGDRPA